MGSTSLNLCVLIPTFPSPLSPSSSPLSTQTASSLFSSLSCHFSLPVLPFFLSPANFSFSLSPSALHLFLSPSLMKGILQLWTRRRFSPKINNCLRSPGLLYGTQQHLWPLAGSKELKTHSPFTCSLHTNGKR